jgi:hypothetical protein
MMSISVLGSTEIDLQFEIELLMQRFEMLKRAERAVGIPLILRSGGKCVVSRVGEAYDARTKGRNRMKPVFLAMLFVTFSSQPQASRAQSTSAGRESGLRGG